MYLTNETRAGNGGWTIIHVIIRYCQGRYSVRGASSVDKVR